jgi:uncharacterized membrane protein YdcZ (DUF606 family)
MGDRKLVALVLVSVGLGAAALALGGAMFWTEYVLRRPASPIMRGSLFIVLGVMIAGIAAYRFFVQAVRSRRPRWQRTYAMLLLLWAGWLFVLAFRGA